ncbi:hypothetical protein E2L06_17620 [Haloterrigena sp. H1]|uniref:hypothetical protein n=1 Tax=Haloterrigena sp. H1 TaxID=2552943 RepID=UPI00110D8725|nr:hypothetical protein [Haloterrigena sp. H1]TMT81730.1 hypothetical protein E2L06_17620 [Haloterrigena sp. H1]
MSDEAFTTSLLGAKALVSLSSGKIATLGLLVLVSSSYFISGNLYQRKFGSKVGFQALFIGSVMISYLILTNNLTNQIILIGTFPIVVQWQIVYLVSVFLPLMGFISYFKCASSCGMDDDVRFSAVIVSASLLVSNSYFILNWFLPIFEILTVVALSLHWKFGTEFRFADLIIRFEESITVINQAALEDIGSYLDAVLIYSAIFVSSLFFLPTLLSHELVTVFLLGFLEAIIAVRLTLAGYFLLGGVSLIVGLQA